MNTENAGKINFLKNFLKFWDEYSFEDILENEELWTIMNEFHENYPFEFSFSEYVNWKEWDADTKYELVLWVKEALYKLGYKKYPETVHKVITVPCLFTLYVETRYNLIEKIEWYKGDKPMTFACGIEFWNWLGELAAESGLNSDDLKYKMAEVNAMDYINYEGSRSFPYNSKKILKLAIAEGLTEEEIDDFDFMENKFQTWFENGLLV